MQTTERVLAERQYLLDASIVKIIKGKKTMHHNDLTKEIFVDLKLPIAAAEIKKRIESLIDRDYLIRNKEDRMIYDYVA